MRKLIWIFVLAAAVVAAGVSPAAASGTDVVVHAAAVSARDQQAVLDYWTPERIAAMPVGPVTPGKPPVDGPDGAGWQPGTAIDRTVGRLFFTERGVDASCTATVLVAANQSTAVTAGHCVHGFDLIGNDPQWTGNLLFVPGFRDNARPFGSFVVHSVVTDRHWVEDDQRSEYDQAFLVLNPGTNGNKASLGQTIGFEVPGSLPAYEFGYPRAAKKDGHQGRPEFTGFRVAVCHGNPAEEPENSVYPVPRGEWGVPCDMGGGSSGGPRLALFNEKWGIGTVIGVNTHAFFLDAKGGACVPQRNDCTRYLAGPQFTATITGPLFQRAQSLLTE